MRNNPRRRVLPGPLIYIVILIILFFALQSWDNNASNNSTTMSYTQVLELVRADISSDADSKTQGISDIIIQGQKLIGRYEDSTLSLTEFGSSSDFNAIIPSESQFCSDVSDIYEEATGKKVTPAEFAFTLTNRIPETEPWWEKWMPTIILGFIFIAFIFFTMQQQGGGKGVMNFGRARTKLNDPSKNKVTFDDVAGEDEEKEELREIVDYLKNPQKFVELGAKIPTGVILVGPPGTGKTLLARAVAGEAGVAFFTISGSDFVEMFVGVGASRVRDLFDQAKQAAPAIVFIDEIDAVGRQRGAGLGGGHDEREQTLNQLLVEMDGFSANQGVIVMAATNRVDILDPALLRPGRFDRRITVNYPDIVGREEILKVHVRNKPLGDDVDLKIIARRTPYFTGADLMNVMNEAALLAARHDEKTISMTRIEEAITRVMAGPEKRSHRVTEADRKLVAYHEGGHAIVSWFIPECDDVHEITTIPRGQAGGYTMYLPQEEFNYITTARLRGQMASLMGGRVAEDIVFGDISTGASSDIKRATQIARSMVTEYGMSAKVGPVFLGSEHEVFLGKSFTQQNSSFSERMNTDIDAEVQRLLEEAYARAKQILTDNREKLEGLATLLIDKEKIDAAEFAQFMGESPKVLLEKPSVEI